MIYVLVFILCKKKREDLGDVFILNFLHFIKQKRNPRHGSLRLNVIYEYLKSHVSKYVIKRGILVQKVCQKVVFHISDTPTK